VKSEVRLSYNDGNQTSFDFAGTECTIPVIISSFSGAVVPYYWYSVIFFFFENSWYSMMAGEYGFLSLFLLPCDLLVVEAHVQQQAASARDGRPLG